MSKFVLIDGHSILNRAFYGVPIFTNSEGLHTNAVFGFLNIMFKIIDSKQPDYMAVAFDVHQPTFRHEMFKDYKGTRKPMMEELREQVPVIKELLQKMNITTVELPGYEADDVIGTLSKKGEKAGMEVDVISGDRDLLQLASDHITICIPKTKKGQTTVEEYNTEGVRKLYKVTPTEFIDVKALMGDSSDNIPGVPGIGEKGATAIISQFGSIENAYDHADEISNTRNRNALLNNYEMAQMSKTLATITFQIFFNKYDKKCGMTGTALTEEKEFREIYGMDVVEVPTNLPVKRIDHNDSVYKTKREKLNAIVEDIVASHEKGQPVLVGTITIDASEELSQLLKKRGIPHKVLNAKFHELEAEIIADAGQIGAVTIATNMAGRGTDIKLGEGVTELGGLKIIGTERHESRRIDNQLRGRAGRQGDPGESKFYISLEDDLMRLFGSQNLMQMFNSLGMPEGEQIQHKMLNKAIERAQKKIESNNYGIRKNLLEYDQINNEQREIIYAERRKVLDGDDMRDTIISMIDELVEKYVNMVIGDDQGPSEWNLKELNEILIPMIPVKPVTGEGCGSKQELIQNLKEEALRLYETKEAEFPEPEQIREIERVVILKVTDSRWMDHIDDMDQLRQGIGLQAFGQRDPVVEYRLQGYDMFNDMTESIREETVKMLMHVRIEQKVEREQVAEVTGTNKDDSANAPVVRKSEKISRNAPCPCGSGKKYKYCCGR